MPTTRILLGTLVGLALATLAPLAGQACSDCTVEIVTSVELTIPESRGGAAAYPLTVTVDGRGRIWVLYQDDLPVIFSPEGQFVRRFSQWGGGPGEFLGPTRVVAVPGDSVAIVDPSNSRVTVFGPELGPARMIRMPSPISRMAIERWPDRVWSSAMILTPSNAGWPLHVLDLSGGSVEALQSFGANQGVLDGGAMAGMRLSRRLFLAPDYLLAADMLTPTIRAWSESLQVQMEWRASLPWFGSSVNQARPGPPNVVDGVMTDGEYIWLFAREGIESAWRAFLESARQTGASEVSAQTAPSEAELFRSHAIIFERNGQLIADVPLDGIVLDVADDGRVLLGKVGEYGTTELLLVRLGLERQ